MTDGAEQHFPQPYLDHESVPSGELEHVWLG